MTQKDLCEIYIFKRGFVQRGYTTQMLSKTGWFYIEFI